MKPLIVYTAITGGLSDTLSAITVPPDVRNRPIQYVCFSDSNIICPEGWEIQPLRFSGTDARRIARWHKTMSHRLFDDVDLTLWHDGTHHLKVNPWKIVDDVDFRRQVFATFRHPLRTCVYEEIQACLDLEKDAPENLLRHASRYRDEGYPQGLGLFETACVLRSTCRAVTALNEIWWREIETGSCRDQISLPYAMWKLRFNAFGVLPGSRDESKYFNFRPHH